MRPIRYHNLIFLHSVGLFKGVLKRFHGSGMGINLSFAVHLRGEKYDRLASILYEIHPIPFDLMDILSEI